DKREDPDGDLVKLGKWLERSNKPSSLLMMMLRDLRDGKPVKEPEYAAAIGSKVHEVEIKKERRASSRSRSRRQDRGSDQARGGRHDRGRDDRGGRRDDRGGGGGGSGGGDRDRDRKRSPERRGGGGGGGDRDRDRR
ncbi:unnamed protein product, partial [Polarella glacialis]